LLNIEEATSVPTDDTLANTANRLPKINNICFTLEAYFKKEYLTWLIRKTNLAHRYQPIWTL
jgi:hypothetical protein